MKNLEARLVVRAKKRQPYPNLSGIFDFNEKVSQAQINEAMQLCSMCVEPAGGRMFCNTENSHKVCE